MELGVEYADELPKLHAEIKRDVSWVLAIQAQAAITTREACRLSRIVKASQMCASRHAPAEHLVR